MTATPKIIVLVFFSLPILMAKNFSQCTRAYMFTLLFVYSCLFSYSMIRDYKLFTKKVKFYIRHHFMASWNILFDPDSEIINQITEFTSIYIVKGKT